MAKRHAAAALSILLFVLAGAFAQPARAAGGTSNVVAAVNNVSSEADKFRSMMSNINASQLHLVDVSSVLSGNSEAAFRTALRKHASGISGLRDTLNHTTVTGTDGVLITLPNLLKKQSMTIDRIVAIYVGSDSEITLFYQ